MGKNILLLVPEAYSYKPKVASGVTVTVCEAEIESELLCFEHEFNTASKAKAEIQNKLFFIIN